MAAASATKTRKTPVRRAAARKTASSATAARKPAPRAAETRKKAVSLDKVQGTVKEVAYAQLGLYGRVYDELNARVSRARKDAPRQWDSLVKRGEQVQRDLEKAQKDLSRDLKKRMTRIEDRVDLEARVQKVRGAMNKLAARVRKAA